MKRIGVMGAAWMASMLLAVSLGGCFSTDEPIVEVSLTFRNASEYEIEGLALQCYGGGEAIRKNPMEYPKNETDVGLKPGEEREYDFSVWESEVLNASWGVNMDVAGVENLCHSDDTIVLGGAAGYEITYGGTDDDGDILFHFTAIEAGGGRAGEGDSPNAAVSEEESEPGEVPGVADSGDFGFERLAGLEFIFGSGVGAWHTTVSIQADGSFSGLFTDSDMGDTGDGYPNGTRYVCDFSGRFSDPVKIGDYEYSMKCESLEIEGTVGEEQIADGERLVTAEPYGFDDADEFLVYLPGKKTEGLPAEYLDWVRWTMGENSESADELGFYGLFNVDGGQGFRAY